MKTQTIWKKLGRFKNIQDEKGAFYFWSRQGGNRQIKVVEQGSECLAFPLLVEKDGSERVVFHATTVKSLVEFLENQS